MKFPGFDDRTAGQMRGVPMPPEALQDLKRTASNRDDASNQSVGASRRSIMNKLALEHHHQFRGARSNGKLEFSDAMDQLD
ncbi:hypothetical protein BA190_25375 [Labrys sp. WJW]|uniref:hypothetical protein n=1 Tax=Labrys sp. WJW TaxID=1737983 RepID=UPI00082FA25A|nr:hypothetical protein [Labrys sp. WJW]OCC02125.1 hypothetical protein BA190_25375 [Labrys sp. WJW]